jgi:hypothetical protein
MFGNHLSLLGKVRLSQVRLCKVKLRYDRLIHLTLRGLVMDGHTSLTLTSLSLI